ncbi:hypothetical protein [Haladaptatus salinisoli]|uniref:hypothetical protein n=1 Tax=Haladaptatus salinisoli TaxID=2884876 RepID=UPI001D0A4B99|nr:hypothetical protein [Haladaptatus salinisoli]
MPDRDTEESERDAVEVNVGFDGESGRKAALDCAVEVIREFESLDVVTVTIPRERRSELEAHAAIRYVEENGTAGTLDA